jgi:hypothetical protein
MRQPLRPAIIVPYPYDVLLLEKLLHPRVEERANDIRAPAMALKRFAVYRAAAGDDVPISDEIVLQSMLPDEAGSIQKMCLVKE